MYDDRTGLRNFRFRCSRPVAVTSHANMCVNMCAEVSPDSRHALSSSPQYDAIDTLRTYRCYVELLRASGLPKQMNHIHASRTSSVHDVVRFAIHFACAVTDGTCCRSCSCAGSVLIVAGDRHEVWCEGLRHEVVYHALAPIAEDRHGHERRRPRPLRVRCARSFVLLWWRRHEHLRHRPHHRHVNGRSLCRLHGARLIDGLVRGLRSSIRTTSFSWL